MWSMHKAKRCYTAQIDERDCGVAALNMILKSYHSDFSLAHLRQLAKTDQEGTTALGIKHAAEQLNFEVTAIKADTSIFDEKELPYPLIAHVVKAGGILHYYVVFGRRGNKLLIGDPDPTVKLTKLTLDQFESVWSGVVLFLAPTISYQPKHEAKGTLLGFVPLLAKQRQLIANIVLAAILITLIGIAGSYFLQAIIDTYVPLAMLGTLGVVAVGLIVAYLFQAVFTYAENFLLTVLGQRLSIEVTLGYIRHLFGLPMSFFSTRRTGEIVSRFTDASKIIDALASTILSIFLNIWIVLAVGIVLCIQNSILFFVVLASLPIYAAVIWLFRMPFTRLNQETMESNAKLSSVIIEDLSGIETIKSLTAEQSSYTEIDTQFADLLKKSFAYQRTDQLQQAIKLGLKLLLNVVVLWIGARFVIQNQLTIGQLLTFNALLTYFTEPLESIINLQPKLQMARVANTRLNEVYLVDSEFKRTRPIKDAGLLHGDIEVKHVNFKYGYGENTLSDVSLTIHPGEKLTIVGMSGSGKTTLAKLLVGFYPIEAGNGELLFNQRDSQAIDLEVLRQYVLYVPQDPVLFSGTVMANLMRGASADVDDQAVINACQRASILDDIMRLPLQFQTQLSESGQALSGGQKQRLAIARALLSPASVLIFDESTSNLDTITERRIVNGLLGLKDKTIIFVAHRLTIAEKTDNIVVLDHGRVVEAGNHKDLLAQGGFYAALIND